MEPDESRTILCGEVAMHDIEGISDGFVPGIFQRHGNLVNEVLSISSDDAVARMRRLASDYGLLCGPSSGAHMLAARRVRETCSDARTVVTILCDEGEKYLNEYFMQAPEPEVGTHRFG